MLIGLYGAVDDEQGLRVLGHALARGVTMIDTADGYGEDGANERLVGRALVGHREDAVVATKFGIAAPGAPHARRVTHTYRHEIWIDGRPERAREAAEASLRRLGIDVIDLYYLHFPDPGVPVEESVGGMAELVHAGKVRHLGLSNLTGEQLRRAAAVHPIAAVQAEYSLWTRGVEEDLLPAAREVGAGLVAWSPLGSGFLAGRPDLGADDFRHNSPRFEGENLERNVDRFAPLRALADEIAVTPAQLALAWLLHQGDDIVPIPGTRSVEHLDANLAAAEVHLSREALARIEEVAPADLAAGRSLLG
ncbi:MAG: aldo/keto reductase [Solirubrobacterales bacterium]|nr:aldo/keto reductase [Solirubrobacterales bacterium]